MEAEEKQEQSKKKAKPVPVTVVNVRGKSALVEYRENGRLKRVIIPADQAGPAVDPDTLEMGVPYGIPWEKRVTVTLTPEGLAECLRTAGLWTAEDLEANPQAALGALQAAYSIDLAAIYRAAAKHKEK